MNEQPWEELTPQQVHAALEAASKQPVGKPQTPQDTVEELFALGESLRDHLIVVSANASLDHVVPILNVVFDGMKTAMEISTQIAKARALYSGEGIEEDTNDEAPTSEEETNEG
ncbi:hypothetical protein KPA07_06100 [Corynebacterium aurimucosum]|uniref:hypothetical protein n=1 Tax=Corynebacterium aurimucosum TaxID=169292 RepID=UPI001C0EA0F8|nr:hypothetical protein [Corynebacterium aurimucosum]MBU5654483.1 hypothetical protein [Corynebacterium aurimucosum]